MNVPQCYSVHTLPVFFVSCIVQRIWKDLKELVLNRSCCVCFVSGLNIFCAWWINNSLFCHQQRKSWCKIWMNLKTNLRNTKKLWNKWRQNRTITKYRYMTLQAVYISHLWWMCTMFIFLFLETFLYIGCLTMKLLLYLHLLNIPFLNSSHFLPSFKLLSFWHIFSTFISFFFLFTFQFAVHNVHENFVFIFSYNTFIPSFLFFITLLSHIFAYIPFFPPLTVSLSFFTCVYCLGVLYELKSTLYGDRVCLPACPLVP